MRRNHLTTKLSISTMLLSICSSVIGLFYPFAQSSITWIDKFNQPVQTYGKTIFYNDSIMVATANVSTDIVILLLSVILLFVHLKFKSKMKNLLMLCLHSIYLYIYATYSLSIVLNPLFFLYVLLMGINFYLVILLMITNNTFNFSHISASKTIGVFYIVVGSIVGLIWISEPLLALLLQQPHPQIGYPTMFTHALDLAIIVPLLYFSGYQVIKGDKAKIIFGLPVLAILVTLFPTILLMTYFQIAAGIQFSLIEVMSMIVSFLVLSISGFVMLVFIFKGVKVNEN